VAVRAEIRCCCDPGKLLGTVEVPDSGFYEGAVLRFALRSDPLDWLKPPPEPQPLLEQGTLSLPVASFGIGRGGILTVGETAWEQGLAIKSNDTPIEVLRRIPTFQEAER
jgi:hypothetical protein